MLMNVALFSFAQNYRPKFNKLDSPTAKLINDVTDGARGQSHYHERTSNQISPQFAQRRNLNQDTVRFAVSFPYRDTNLPKFIAVSLKLLSPFPLCVPHNLQSRAYYDRLFMEVYPSEFPVASPSVREMFCW